MGATTEFALDPATGNLIAIGDWLTVWRTPEFDEIAMASGHKRFVQSVAFVPGRDELLTAGLEGGLLLWRLPEDGAGRSAPISMEAVQSFRAPASEKTMTSVVVDPTGQYAVNCSPGRALVWSLDGRLLDRVGTGSSWSEDQCAAFGEELNGFWSVSPGGDTIRFYDFDARTMTKTVAAPTGTKIVAAASRGGLLVADAEFNVHLLRPGDARRLQPGFKAGVKAVVMTREGDRRPQARGTLLAYADEAG